MLLFLWMLADNNSFFFSPTAFSTTGKERGVSLVLMAKATEEFFQWVKARVRAKEKEKARVKEKAKARVKVCIF